MKGARHGKLAPHGSASAAAAFGTFAAMFGGQRGPPQGQGQAGVPPGLAMGGGGEMAMATGTGALHARGWRSGNGEEKGRPRASSTSSTGTAQSFADSVDSGPSSPAIAGRPGTTFPYFATPASPSAPPGLARKTSASALASNAAPYGSSPPTAPPPQSLLARAFAGASAGQVYRHVTKKPSWLGGNAGNAVAVQDVPYQQQFGGPQQPPSFNPVVMGHRQTSAPGSLTGIYNPYASPPPPPQLPTPVPLDRQPSTASSSGGQAVRFHDRVKVETTYSQCEYDRRPPTPDPISERDAVSHVLFRSSLPMPGMQPPEDTPSVPTPVASPRAAPAAMRSPPLTSALPGAFDAAGYFGAGLATRSFSNPPAAPVPANAGPVGRKPIGSPPTRAAQPELATSPPITHTILFRHGAPFMGLASDAAGMEANPSALPGGVVSPVLTPASPHLHPHPLSPPLSPFFPALAPTASAPAHVGRHTTVPRKPSFTKLPVSPASPPMTPGEFGGGMRSPILSPMMLPAAVAAPATRPALAMSPTVAPGMVRGASAPPAGAGDAEMPFVAALRREAARLRAAMGNGEPCFRHEGDGVRRVEVGEETARRMAVAAAMCAGLAVAGVGRDEEVEDEEAAAAAGVSLCDVLDAGEDGVVAPCGCVIGKAVAAAVEAVARGGAVGRRRGRSNDPRVMVVLLMAMKTRTTEMIDAAGPTSCVSEGVRCGCGREGGGSVAGFVPWW
ncbi:hypothetical protein HDU96_006388 [Phlyctochytrium bullatum]|nr:hypothetical protein HDU96_006388 [Phlyctochytrium bullatum]